MLPPTAMKRSTFIQHLLGAGVLPAVSLASPTTTPDVATEARRLRRELDEAWAMSERMTLMTASQMPAEHYQFKYTPEAMTFATQWRHCCEFTLAQVCDRLGLENPYNKRPLPTAMTKAESLAALKDMYAYVRNAIQTAPDEKLLAEDAFADGKIPNWRLLYAMENHIIHHRGQAMVYLRLKGVTPEGYLGW